MGLNWKANSCTRSYSHIAGWLRRCDSQLPRRFLKTRGEAKLRSEATKMKGWATKHRGEGASCTSMRPLKPAGMLAGTGGKGQGCKEGREERMRHTKTMLHQAGRQQNERAHGSQKNTYSTGLTDSRANSTQMVKQKQGIQHKATTSEQEALERQGPAPYASSKPGEEYCAGPS